MQASVTFDTNNQEELRSLSDFIGTLLQRQNQPQVFSQIQSPAVAAPTAQQPAQAPAYQTPVTTGIPTAAPAVSAVNAAPNPVPVGAAPEYTLEQIQRAAAQLSDMGKRQDMLNLIHSFSVQALTQLPKDKYGAFVTGLRGLGAAI